MTTHDISKTERIEMYLKAVWTLQVTSPPATVSRVAEFMGVSSPSASEMLKRLDHQGFVAPADDGVQVTEQGRRVAVQVVRRLRLAERLLADILKLDLAHVYDEACKMEHVISAEVEERLAQVLGHPSTCPHGLPIPDQDGAVSVERLPTLLEVAAGARGTIASVPEEDTGMVEYLARLGLVPGAQVAVDEVAPFNGPLLVRVASERQAIGRDVARRIRVKA